MAMSMRERIARAICRVEYGDDPDAVEMFGDAADAVLSELLTPTDGMVEDMACVFGVNINDDDDATKAFLDDMGKAFTAAILAAKEGK